MKIKKVLLNNRKKVFEVEVDLVVKQKRSDAHADARVEMSGM